MLTICRKLGERLIIDNNLKIKITSIGKEKVILHIENNTNKEIISNPSKSFFYNSELGVAIYLYDEVSIILKPVFRNGFKLNLNCVYISIIAPISVGIDREELFIKNNNIHTRVDKNEKSEEANGNR